MFLFEDYIWRMLRKAVVLLILTSMTLHCASRTGFLSYLYEHRMEIAYSLGLIDEVPISICHDAYEFNKGLTITTHDAPKSSLPSCLSQAREIILFCQTPVFISELEPTGLTLLHITVLLQRNYSSPGLSIFHPPV